MLTLTLASGESQFLFRLFKGSSKTLDFLKDRINHIFSDILYHQVEFNYIVARRSHNGELSNAIDDMIETIEDQCPVKDEDGFWKRKDFDGKGGPKPVYNALDSLLKDSLDRLKTMRENIVRAHSSLYSRTSEADYATHISVVRTLCLEGKLGAALYLRNQMIQTGKTVDVLTHNYLVNGFCKAGELERANLLVQEMLSWGSTPGLVTFNTLIKGYCLIDTVDKALDVLSSMANCGFTSNTVTSNILVHALCKKGLLEEAKILQKELLDEALDTDCSELTTSTILMNGYFKNGDPEKALATWKEMGKRGIQLDVIAYNVIINGLCLSQELIHAYQYLSEMFKRGFPPDLFTYNTLISALCKEGLTDEACYIHVVMLRMGVTPDQITYKILIQGLCLHGNAEKAKDFLILLLE